MNIENEFADFIMQTNKDGSNKARSYLLALKSVNTLLRGGFLPEFDIGNIYDVTDVATLNRLGKHIHKEGRDPQASLIDPDAGEKAKLQPRQRPLPLGHLCRGIQGPSHHLRRKAPASAFEVAPRAHDLEHLRLGVQTIRELANPYRASLPARREIPRPSPRTTGRMNEKLI